MTEGVPNPQRISLAGFAEYLANQRTTIIEQWLLIVRRDTQIETADRLRHHELVDHLPRLLQELCDFLRARDADILTGEARRDATSHGELRWQGGYKIDELLRELEAFRQLVTSSAFRYRQVHPDFKGSLEVSAHGLIHQFFAEIVVASTRQFMNEQQNAARSCADELATAQQELGRANVKLERALKERHLGSTIVAQELRKLLQQLPQSDPVAGSAQALHSFVEQLVEYAELSGGGVQPQRHSFDPRALFSEIVAAYRPAIEAKGLRLLTDCVTAPAAVPGDRAKIRRIAEILLDTALQSTASGQVSFAFAFSDPPRWTITISDTSSGSSPGVDGPPLRGVALAIAEELIAVLGGSLNTEVHSGVGVRVEVTLPRHPDLQLLQSAGQIRPDF
jgi:signal transduction histidine kinase